jgi:hypothetical protein
MGKCNSYVCRQERDALTAEVERLRAVLHDTADLQPRIHNGLSAASATITRLTARVAKLEAALEEVRVLVFCANHSEARYPKARAALSPAITPMEKT